MTRDSTEPQFVAACDLPWEEPTPLIRFPFLLLPAQRHVLHARPSDGKTLVAMRACVELERLGKRSVVVASEGRGQLGRRIVMVGRGADPTREFGREIHVLKPESRWRLRELHDQILRLDPSLAVIDTMIGFLDGADENSADQIQAFFEQNIEPLCRHGIAVLLLHHNNRARAADPWTAIRGSSAIAGWADAVYSLQADENAREQLSVTCTKMRELQLPAAYRLTLSIKDDVVRVEPLGLARGPVVIRTRSSSLETAIVAQLQSRASPATLSELADALKKSNGAVSAALKILTEGGRVERVPVSRHDRLGRPRTDSAYALTTPGHPDGHRDAHPELSADKGTTGHTPSGVSGCPADEAEDVATFLARAQSIAAARSS